MDQKALFRLAEDIIAGVSLDAETCRRLAHIPERDAFMLFPGANMIRDPILAGRYTSAQSATANQAGAAKIAVFAPSQHLQRRMRRFMVCWRKMSFKRGGAMPPGTPINRYSIVTSGKRLPRDEVAAVAGAFSELDKREIGICASLDILDPR